MSSTTGPIVVGIGSSAGGLEALESLFRAMPARTGLAYVIVTHLAAGQKTALPEILARYATMPVALAQDGDAVSGDQVYVAPADASLMIEGGRLRLHSIQGARHEHHPIDIFLASLAEDQGERAVAVILSGAGSDGALGLTAVKEQGGLTIAQGSAHTTPRYPDMPSNAIATGFVDLILPAEEIPAKLLEYVHSFDALAPVLANDPPIQARDKTVVRPQEAISAILRDQLRHDFSAYKDKTFLRRVQRRMQVLQLTDVEAYVALLRQDNGEAKLLFRDLLINVTGFFRDTESFEALEQQVIPKLFEGKDAGDSVRVWIPGCATGEEAYSIAILLHEHLDKLKIAPKVQIFASDIDEAALDAARAGRYVAASLGSVTPARRDRYFTTDGVIYAVAKSVRDMCIFSLHSVIRDPPFSHLDLISCRNLLIYLNIDAQTRLLPVFHYALRPKGYLFLGSAEGVGQQSDLFSPLDKKSRLFQRRESIGRTPPRFPLSVPEPRLGSFSGGHYRRDYAAEPGVQRAVEAALLGSLAPAHVVINEDGEAVYYSSRIGKYLGPAPGFPNRQVLPMARKGLRLDLRLAMEEAVASRRAITRERVALELDGNLVQFVNLTVAPLPNQERGGSLFLILFIDLGQPVPVEQLAARARDGQPSMDVDTAQLIAQLERELKDTRDRLQATIEEHEIGLEEVRSTNEELVSLNEELQSTNEELETSKEEIQSVNEELNTVNQELSSKVDQLNLANADLKNLFDGTRIAVVFLDQRLVVRNFTPAATDLFNLIASDRGRPLTDITGHVDHPGLQDDLRQVLAQGQPIERRVSRHDGQANYLMRILPYRDGGMDEGVIVTFVDVTALAEAERQQQVMIHELNHRVRNVLAVVAVIARQTLAAGGAPAGIEEVLSGRIAALGRAYGLVTRERWGAVAFEEVIQEELKPHLDAYEPRFTSKGPRVMLNSKSAVAFGLVLHELATNAIKHGALSTAQGRITAEWRVEERDGARWLQFDWQEADGPKVQQPVKKGFGSRLIETEICHDLQGEVRTEFREAGILVSLSVPLMPAE